jgi:hypothetical protein
MASWLPSPFRLAKCALVGQVLDHQPVPGASRHGGRGQSGGDPGRAVGGSGACGGGPRSRTGEPPSQMHLEEGWTNGPYIPALTIGHAA